jgi:hypothetical protein
MVYYPLSNSLAALEIIFSMLQSAAYFDGLLGYYNWQAIG